MASTGLQGELHSLGMRFGLMKKSLTVQTLLRTIGGGFDQTPTPLGITRVNALRVSQSKGRRPTADP